MGVPKNERAARVDEAAQLVARVLHDLHSVNFYRRIFWQTYRAYDVGVALRPNGRSPLFDDLASLISRVVQLKREGVAENPGKVANALVKGWVWWEEVERVGIRKAAGSRANPGAQRSRS